MLEQQLSQTIQIDYNFELELEASICRDSLYFFVKSAWQEVEQDPFVDGWHIRMLCEALENLYYGKIESNNLVINVPPRHMKSLLVDVFFPAWVWTREPNKKFLCLSYTESTISSIMAKTKKLLKSVWYQERFHVTMATNPDTNTRFANLQGGYIYAFGFGGAVTGEGGDFLLIDDPLKASDADSDAIREQVNLDYDNAISNRLNNPMTGKRIIIMQRLHERDLIGHLISKKIRFEHIVLPFEYEGERFSSIIGITDQRTATGEVLWKERFTNDEKLREYKLNYAGERAIAGQLQQRPSPAGGFIFKKEWFVRFNRPSDIVGTFISWDTAESINPDAAYSCGVVGQLRADYTVMVVEVVRKRLLFPQLQDAIETLAVKYRPTLSGVIIEYKSSGIQAVQTIKQSSPQWLADIVYAFNPRGDKDARQFQAASYCELGCVLFPHPSPDYPWLLDFEEEIFTTPSSPFRDQADALSQLILYLRSYLSEGWRARTENQLQIPTLEGVL